MAARAVLQPRPETAQHEPFFMVVLPPFVFG
jgi:hypothetical protein